MRAISFDYRFDATGTNNDRDTKAYFRHLSEDFPWIEDMMEVVNGIFQQSNERQNSWEREYGFNLKENLSKKGDNYDEENADFSLSVWGTSCPYLHQNRGNYRNKVIR